MPPMTISALSQSDLEKIGAAVFRYVEQLGSQSNPLAKHRGLMIGRLPPPGEAPFLDHRKDLANKPVCIRGFRSPEERENWRENFEATALGMEASVQRIDGEQSPIPGTFDLV